MNALAEQIKDRFCNDTMSEVQKNAFAFAVMAKIKNNSEYPTRQEFEANGIKFNQLIDVLNNINLKVVIELKNQGHGKRK